MDPENPAPVDDAHPPTPRTIQECVDAAEILYPLPEPCGSNLASAAPAATPNQQHENGPEDPQPRMVSGDDIVRMMNHTHAVVLYGSRPMVLLEHAEAHIADRIKLMKFEAFRAFYLNRNSLVCCTNSLTGETKKQRVNHAQYWLGHEDRREYKGVEFFPDPHTAQGTPGYYNLWRGFSVQPDMLTPPDLRCMKYKTFLDHLRVNIASENKSNFAWLWAWMAHIVQKPRERLGTAVVLRGAMGVGKSVAGEVIGSLFEQHYFQVDDARYLTGQFNSHMAGCILLQVDEGVWAGDKSAEGRLKGLVSGSTQMIEAKGVDPIKMPNYVRLLFTSNEGWVVPAGQDERRFAVFDVADHAKQNHGYFAEMQQELDAGGREASLRGSQDRNHPVSTEERDKPSGARRVAWRNVAFRYQAPDRVAAEPVRLTAAACVEDTVRVIQERPQEAARDAPLSQTHLGVTGKIIFASDHWQELQWHEGILADCRARKHLNSSESWDKT